MRLSWIALLFPLLAWRLPAAPANELEAVVATDLGTFRFAFDADQAPKHVEVVPELPTTATKPLASTRR